MTNRYWQVIGRYSALKAHEKYSLIDNLSTQSVGYIFLAFFILQTKVASPTRFVAANAMVAVLPQSKISSLSKRPTVPMKIRMKPASFRDSLIDMSRESLVTVTLRLHA